MKHSPRYPESACAFFLFFFVSLPMWAQDSPPEPTSNPPGSKPAANLANPDSLPPDFSEKDLFSIQHFHEPLVPLPGSDSKKERDALRAAINDQLDADRLNEAKLASDLGTDPLEAFIQAFPSSRWKPAIELNLADKRYRLGYFSRALAHWESAYEQAKHAEEPKAKALANAALARLTRMNAGLGRMEKMSPLLEEASGRKTEGAAQQMLETSRESLWKMENDPGDAFKCGPYALGNVIEVLTRTERKSKNEVFSMPKKIMEVQSPQRGFSFAEVADLAAELETPHQLVCWDEKSGERRIPVPGIVHWKLNHYAAILEQKGDLFLVRDPTFPYEAWVPRDAILEEASGHFLVPQQAVPPGFAALKREAADEIYGRGFTYAHEPNQTSDCDKKSGGNSSECPMATYAFHTMMVSLHVQDTPVGYDPPIGPSLKVRVAYNERETIQGSNMNFTNFGRQWGYNWQGYIDVVGNEATVVLRGGGTEFHTNWSSGERDFKTRALLTGPTDDTMERLLPDGSREVYGRKVSNRYWLTAIVDAHGNEVTLSYDSLGRLETLADLNANETTFFYEHPDDDYKVTTIEDPFGRTAEFDYNSAGQLVKITDILGLESEFGYASGDIIGSITTPYGTTSFTRTGSGMVRAIESTDPMGDQEKLSYPNVVGNIPGQIPGSPLPAGSISVDGQNVSFLNGFHWDQYRNTFFWDKKAMKFLDGVTNETARYQAARIFHWLHTPSSNTSSFLESYKDPLSSRVWFNYPGQSPSVAYASVFQGSTGIPNKMARVIEGGATQLWQQDHNDWGKITRSVDPLGRELVYEYASNGLDLTKIKRKTGTSTYDTLFEATWNTQHLPTSVTDAAGETTTMTWNASGQLTSITTPLSETTDFTYDTDGFLTEIDGPLTGTSDVVTLTWDTFGRMATITFDGTTVAYEYDAADRVSKTTYPDATYEEFEYTNLDRTRVRDRMGRFTDYEYNANRQLVKVTDPVERETEFDWCRCGSLKLIKDGEGNETRWKYDVQGRPIEKIFADNSKILYDYSPARGLLEEITDALDQKKIFTYAIDDRLFEIEYEDAIHATPGVSMEWDARYPRLVSMEDGLGETTYAYHPAGQPGAGLLAEIDGPLVDDTITYGYDEHSRLMEREINGTANRTEWSHDALDRITEIVNALGTFTATYDGPSSRVATMSRSGGMVTAFDYLDDEGDHRLEKITHKKDGTNPWLEFEYEYNAVGNILEWVQTLGTQPTETYDLTYDDADQLTAAVLNRAGVTEPIQDREFAYDDAGNRTEADEEPAWFNNLNQLTGTGDPGLTLVSGEVNTPSTVKVNDETVTLSPSTEFEIEKDWPVGPVEFTVEAINEVNVSVSNTYTFDVPPERTFEYDLNGNMISDGERTYEWDAENRLLAINYDEENEARTEFEYDGVGRRVRILELDDETVQSDQWFVWDGMEIVEERDDSGTVVRSFYPQGEKVHVGPTTPGNNYYLRDHLGSVVAALYQAGDTAAWRYDVWGKRTVRILSPPANAVMGYTGHYTHGRSGLVLAPFRAYWPETGRWLSRDPIGEMSDGPNLYSYVLNNPISFIDPDGLRLRVPDPSQRDSVMDTLSEFVNGELSIDKDGYISRSSGMGDNGYDEDFDALTKCSNTYNIHANRGTPFTPANFEPSSSGGDIYYDPNINLNYRSGMFSLEPHSAGTALAHELMRGYAHCQNEPGTSRGDSRSEREAANDRTMDRANRVFDRMNKPKRTAY